MKLRTLPLTLALLVGSALGASAQTLYFSAIPDEDETRLVERFSAVADYVFAVIPLFVLMGLLATNAGATRDLFSAAEALLRRITAWLMEAGPEIGLRIVGYADIDGSGEPSNRITSQKRADAVRQMMLDLGIPGDRVVAVGRSTENRLVDDDSSGNANRRVAFEPFLRPEQTP